MSYPATFEHVQEVITEISEIKELIKSTSGYFAQDSENPVQREEESQLITEPGTIDSATALSFSLDPELLSSTLIDGRGNLKRLEERMQLCLEQLKGIMEEIEDCTRQASGDVRTTTDGFIDVTL
eukprot:m.16918 g.16918  ORF g.16918 m.16918 type:complete len:125 (+) comp27202_c0_seq2:609-983(+)